MKNRMYWGVGILILLLGFVVLFSTLKPSDTGGETVYNPPSDEVLENIRNKLKAQRTQEVDDTKKPPPGETFETGHWDGDHWHKTSPMSQSAVLTSTLHNNELERGEIETLTLDQLKTQIDKINARVQDQYPEFQVLTTLTPEEIVARYPTEVDRTNLAQRANDFLITYLEEIKIVFAAAPVEIRRKVFESVYNQLIQSWGTQMANTVTEILNDLLEE